MTLIAVSGVDGSGKSTQIALLADALSTAGHAVRIRWFRPGYSSQAERLKRDLRIPSAAESGSAEGRTPGDGAAHRERAMSRKSVRLAWLAFAIADSMVEFGVVARVLSRRSSVVYDRWVLDAGLDLQINFPEYRTIVRIAILMFRVVAPTPDATLLLIVPEEIAQNRLSLKAEPFPDPASVALARRAGYEAEAVRSPQLVIDGSGNVDDVHRKVLSRVDLFG